jgi:hypothetical protein
MSGKGGDANMLRLWTHYFALVAEVSGTILVSLDLIRIDTLASAAGTIDDAGEPAKYHGWIWHSGLPGSGLLLIGILLAGIALVLEHREMIVSRRSIRQAALNGEVRP